MSKRHIYLFSPKKIAFAAMLVAMSVIIGIFCKNFMNFGLGLFRITFENLPIILAGIYLGPIVILPLFPLYNHFHTITKVK